MKPPDLWNRKDAYGVYRTMLRGLACLLCTVGALAQVQPQDPIDAALQDCWAARGEGRFAEAMASREKARLLLNQVPVTSPRFESWVQSIAQLFQDSGMNAKAREVVEAALARMGKNSPGPLLLNMLADSWQADRNLLKAAEYREAAAAAPSTTPGRALDNGAGISFSFRGVPVSNEFYTLRRLAELYQQLGRPEAVTQVVTKMNDVANGHGGVGQYYEQQGQLDAAAAIYQKQASEAAGPIQKAEALQSLANVYSREERYDDAAAVLAQAAASAESADLQTRNRSAWILDQRARALQQAGHIDAADAAYGQILADNGIPEDARHQILLNYANYLAQTKRSAQATSLLIDYASSHAAAQPWQESNIYSTLANVARLGGDPKRADEYQRKAQDLQQSVPQGQPDSQFRIGPDLQKAQAAVDAGHSDDAFSITLRALDASDRAMDRGQITWTVPFIATNLANHHAAGQADQLYQRLFAVMEGRGDENGQPRLNVAENYVRFLMSQTGRLAEVPDAIERYAALLRAANGPGTGTMSNVLDMKMEWERRNHSPASKVAALAQDKVALEESLSGRTSQPYQQALVQLAASYEAAGDSARALPLRQQAVAIADLAWPAGSREQAQTRIDTAFALARQQRFDEAERLGLEAAAIGQHMHPPQTQYASQLADIRKMRAASQAAAAPKIPQ